jgi:hypothetical protein
LFPPFESILERNKYVPASGTVKVNVDVLYALPMFNVAKLKGYNIL